MKSGLEGRNNRRVWARGLHDISVSIKSGLEGRNNLVHGPPRWSVSKLVSMKSGLEGRNNSSGSGRGRQAFGSLNEVRPRRPEQFDGISALVTSLYVVSMKSGLEGRNNGHHPHEGQAPKSVSMKSGLEGRNNHGRLHADTAPLVVSMKSGLEGRNNALR